MEHASSTQEIPPHGDVPRHVAIIMDGNGRWARRRRPPRPAGPPPGAVPRPGATIMDGTGRGARRGRLPRIAGHRRGVEAVRGAVRSCVERGIEYLTLFAFSSENWRRPDE